MFLFKQSVPNRLISEFRLEADRLSLTATVGKLWYWEAFSGDEIIKSNKRNRQKQDQENEVSGENSLGAGVITIYRALAEIELNENGSLVLDQRVTLALDDIFAESPQDLSAEHLQNIKDIILRGMPGESGETLANLVSQYKAYSDAQKLMPSVDNERSTVATLARYNELVSLRQKHFGEELAESIYGEEQAMARSMLQSIIQKNEAGLVGVEKNQH